MTSSEPATKDAAVTEVHSALDAVENAFKHAYGTLSDKVQTLLAHLHKQADGVSTEVEGDLGQDVTEVKQDAASVIDAATGQTVTGGGSNPNAAPVTVENPTGQK